MTPMDKLTSMKQVDLVALCEKWGVKVHASRGKLKEKRLPVQERLIAAGWPDGKVESEPLEASEMTAEPVVVESATALIEAPTEEEIAPVEAVVAVAEVPVAPKPYDVRVEATRTESGNVIDDIYLNGHYAMSVMPVEDGVFVGIADAKGYEKSFLTYSEAREWIEEQLAS